MKKLLALALVALMAGGAAAQDYGDIGGAMGMFFSESDFSDATTNTDQTATGVTGYIVLLNCPVSSIGGYEVGITLPGAVFVLDAGGPNGWTNFGNSTNHLAAYTGGALPVNNGAVVLGFIEMLYTAISPVEIQFGPSSPSSFGPNNPQGIFWDGPAVADGTVPEILYRCWLTGGVSGEVATVATLHGTGITATEQRTLSGVKALFD
jgi:hypothetical protein